MTSFVSPRGLLKNPISCSTFIITFNKPLDGNVGNIFGYQFFSHQTGCGFIKIPQTIVPNNHVLTTVN
ncbi:MAG: hypothetical protein Edafosvirus8_36 [Edafosvirus sp.]|uniref:Uncharacterized protein n=1 Tax=Edafosvirus sp. TaxID=2487765 RepID=A0A3G4ZTR0_9VIRU|nr:MAG: hypothetical protein Edafosvirus8_36 [Edafosvirus sp.]